MLVELQTDGMALSFIMGTGGLSIALQLSGDMDYSEQVLELAFGKNLGRLELGIRFGYLLDLAAGYRYTGFGSTGIAIRFHVNEKMITGWELGLALFGKAGNVNPERGTQFFRLGFGYETNASLFMAIEVEKISGLSMNVIPSIEYRYGEHFFFSIGINSNTASPNFKTGWKKNQVFIQLFTVYEPVLGISPGLRLLWDENREEIANRIFVFYLLFRWNCTNTKFS